MKSFKQFVSTLDEDMWHGSPSGKLSDTVHVGTRKAAEEALTARIGYPADGEWDGSRKYNETKLAGKHTMIARGLSVCGHNCHAPDHDYYPHEHPEGMPTYSDSSKLTGDEYPTIKKYTLQGKMTNSLTNPRSDRIANSIAKRGGMKRGVFYKNDAEDAGSISAVVPKGHLKESEDYSHLKPHPIEKMRDYTEAEKPWEWREYDRYARPIFPRAFDSPEHFWSKYKEAPLRHLTPDELKNLDYSTAGSYLGNEPGKHERALRHFTGHRDLNRIQDHLNTRIAPPIVLRHSRGLRILGGNTRTSVALAQNINLPMKVIDISDRH